MQSLIADIPAPDLRIQPAQPRDAAFLLACYAASRDAEMAQAAWDTATKNSVLRMQFEAQTRQYNALHPVATRYVIHTADGPVGSLWLARSPGEIKLLDIAILPQSRNQGLGSALLNRIQIEATATQKIIVLHVWAANTRALRLYRRFGFAGASGDGMHMRLTWRPSFTAQFAYQF